MNFGRDRALELFNWPFTCSSFSSSFKMLIYITKIWGIFDNELCTKNIFEHFLSINISISWDTCIYLGKSGSDRNREPTSVNLDRNELRGNQKCALILVVLIVAHNSDLTIALIIISRSVVSILYLDSYKTLTSEQIQ